jgi:hypothetical protein
VKQAGIGGGKNMEYQLLVYADDVNLLGDNTDTSIDASKEVGLETQRKVSIFFAILSPECRSRSRHKSSKQII